MKRIFNFLALCLITAALSAQVSFDYVAASSTLTNQDTAYVTLTRDYTNVGTVECGVKATNVSGTTAAGARIQVNHSPVGTNWVNATTDTLAIVNGTISVTGITLKAYRCRLMLFSTGTQVTTVASACTYKKS